MKTVPKSARIALIAIISVLVGLVLGPLFIPADASAATASQTASVVVSRSASND